MKKILQITILFSLIFSGCASNLSQNNSELVDPKKIYSPEELKEDMDFLFHTMENVHPNLYAFTPKDVIDSLRTIAESQFNKPLNALEFCKSVTPIVAKLGDGHTNLNFPYIFRQTYLDSGGLIVPFDIYIDSGKMFVEINYSSDSTLTVNSEILSINDIPAQDIIREMVRYVSGERIENRYNRIKRNFKLLLWALYGFENQFTVEYISAYDGKEYINNFHGTDEDVINSLKNQHSEIKIKPYSFTSIPEKSIGIIDFKQLVEYDNFKVFIKDAFQKIRDDGIRNLIIDIRQNGGGNSRIGDELINYMFKEPYYQFEGVEIKFSKEIRHVYFDRFIKWYMYPLIPFAYLHSGSRGFLRGSGTVLNYKGTPREPNNNELFFDGNIYLLTGPKTFSSASSLTSAFKCFKIGTIIGEETGGLTVSYGDVYYHTLPNTGIQGGVSHKKFIQTCGKEDGHGVIPDFVVRQTPEDREKGIDTVMEFTKKLIKKNKTTGVLD